MDMAAARLEASFLAPDLHGASGEILHNSGDEENERKSLLHQTQAYDQMLMDMETNMHKSSYSSETQCDCGSVEYKQALDLHPPVRHAPPPTRNACQFFHPPRWCNFVPCPKIEIGCTISHFPLMQSTM